MRVGKGALIRAFTPVFAGYGATCPRGGAQSTERLRVGTAKTPLPTLHAASIPSGGTANLIRLMAG